MSEGDRERAVAKCCDCGSVYAVNVWKDGRISPIGRSGCDCGSSEFELIGDSVEIVLEDDGESVANEE